MRAQSKQYLISQPQHWREHVSEAELAEEQTQLHWLEHVSEAELEEEQAQLQLHLEESIMMIMSIKSSSLLHIRGEITNPN